MDAADPKLFDVTEEYQRHRLMLRSIWNTYVWSHSVLRDWDMVNRFENVKRTLASEMLDQGIRLACEISDDASLHTVVVPWRWGRDIKRGAPVRISETLTPKSGRYWNQAPDYIHAADMVLSFRDFYDVAPASFWDLTYYLASITASEKYPELIGRDVLLEANTVKILVFTEPVTQSLLEDALRNL